MAEPARDIIPHIFIFNLFARESGVLTFHMRTPGISIEGGNLGGTL
jgi:hypothetical protein